MQRIRAKEAKQAIVRSKKRPLEEDEVDRPQKTVRISTSRTRNAGDSRDSSIGRSNRTAQKTPCTASNIEAASSDIHHGLQSEKTISQFGRSGRAIRLPTRFR
jgi:hypothetical protein